MRQLFCDGTKTAPDAMKLRCIPSQSTSDEPLPPALRRPTSPLSHPDNPHSFAEAEDRMGLAFVRSRFHSASTSPVTTTSLPSITVSSILPSNSKVSASTSVSSDVVTVITSVPSVPVSRTTEWRHRKRAAETDCSEPKKARKEYCCRVCGQVIRGGKLCVATPIANTTLHADTSHTQYEGKRYCPKVPGQLPKEEWLKLQKAACAN